MDMGNMRICDDFALALAPMAGYTSAPFRECMAPRGADLLYSELASASALSRKKMGKTKKIIEVSEHGITGIQLFTANPDDIAQSAKALSSQIETGECKAKFIDINLGCPAPKVVRNGAGSALLLSPEKMKALVGAAVKASAVPVTAKTRTGYRLAEAAKHAKLLEEEGICALTIHGRTASQKFSGKADWASIKSAVDAVSIPVIGNGDVHSAEDALRMLETTGCAGVMIGRAALENPLVFMQVRQLRKGGKYVATTKKDKADFLRQYSSLSIDAGIKFSEIKKISMQLCAGEEGAAQKRGRLMNAKSPEELLQIL